ncbi:MAG TPA: hypothetical protein VIL85_27750 [Thermomicrobiales bacterium]|jgi:hypothetical protein
MTQQEPLAIVAARLAAYLPPGADEAECTIPVDEINGWLAAADAPPLPAAAQEQAWWDGLHRRRDYPALPNARWRVERIDWDGAGITFGWADARGDATDG